MRVILASGSPRRFELLSGLVPKFDVVVSDVDEDALTTPDPQQTAERLAEAKAIAVVQRFPDFVVVGADTVVAVDDRQLAKPIDVDDAVRMLAKLSGRTHRVITGVCVVAAGRTRVFSETTIVTFRPISREEILAYVATGEPMDKAGAYAIQGGASAFVSRLEGSVTNVVGLPMERLAEEWLRLLPPER